MFTLVLLDVKLLYLILSGCSWIYGKQLVKAFPFSGCHGLAGAGYCHAPATRAAQPLRAVQFVLVTPSPYSATPQHKAARGAEVCELHRPLTAQGWGAPRPPPRAAAAMAVPVQRVFVHGHTSQLPAVKLWLSCCTGNLNAHAKKHQKGCFCSSLGLEVGPTQCFQPPHFQFCYFRQLQRTKGSCNVKVAVS